MIGGEGVEGEQVLLARSLAEIAITEYIYGEPNPRVRSVPDPEEDAFELYEAKCWLLAASTELGTGTEVGYVLPALKTEGRG